MMLTVAGASAAPALSEVSQRAAQAAPIDPEAGARIGVRVVDGDGEFYRVATGETWVPRGTNLIRFERGGAEGMISPSAVDWDWTEARFEEIAGTGFNVVRVFHEMCLDSVDCVGASGERISDGFLDNAVEYLHRASAHGLHVMFSSNDLPPDSWYVHNGFDEGESEFVSAGNVEAHRAYHTDFIRGLLERDAPMDWLWAYELRNEYTYQTDWPPWNWDEGLFTAANGQTYDMSRPQDRRALSADSLVYWADEMTAEVKSLEPDLLVSIGLLLPDDHLDTLSDPADPRWLISGDFHDRTAVDFVDIHGAMPSVILAHKQWNLPADKTMPIVVGEFAGDFSSPDIVAGAAAEWQAATCQAGFDGWLTWHWGTTAGTPIEAALSPDRNPDPCIRPDVEVQQVSWRKPVRASQSEAKRYGPRHLVDNDPESYWSAGDGGPQWAEIDLRERVDIGMVRLPIGIVTPQGRADIRILVRGPGTRGKLREAHRFRQRIEAGDVLQHTFVVPARDVRFVRVLVKDMNDSWVILHDVEVYRASEDVRLGQEPVQPA
jgi:hypothetical protein